MILNAGVCGGIAMGMLMRPVVGMLGMTGLMVRRTRIERMLRCSLTRCTTDHHDRRGIAPNGQ